MPGTICSAGSRAPPCRTTTFRGVSEGAGFRLCRFFRATAGRFSGVSGVGLVSAGDGAAAGIFAGSVSVGVDSLGLDGEEVGGAVDGAGLDAAGGD